MCPSSDAREKSWMVRQRSIYQAKKKYVWRDMLKEALSSMRLCRPLLGCFAVFPALLLFAGLQ